MTTLLTVMLVFWGGLTTILVVLLIYRNTLNLHQSDQLFLDAAEDHLAREQQQLARKIKKLSPWVRGFGVSSGSVFVVFLVLAALQMLKIAAER